MRIDSTQQHTIGLLVENRSGVLARIAGLIAAKGYNIDSLSVGPTHDETISRMTIVVRGDDAEIEQALKQLHRLIDVIKVQHLASSDRVDRGLALIRVNGTNDQRAELLRLAEIFRANVIDVSPSTLTLELTGDSEKLDAFIDMLKPQQIEEVARTGVVALPRSAKSKGRRVRSDASSASANGTRSVTVQPPGNVSTCPSTPDRSAVAGERPDRLRSASPRRAHSGAEAPERLPRSIRITNEGDNP